jgi:hypothetical protein
MRVRTIRKGTHGWKGSYGQWGRGVKGLPLEWKRKKKARRAWGAHTATKEGSPRKLRDPQLDG